MVTLYWDSGNKLDCFDNPNCFFDQDGIGRRREPGDAGYVEWYPPGYTPPEPPPHHHRKHRPSTHNKDNTEPTTPNPMDNHFHYNVVPQPGGSRYSTRVVHQEDLLTYELVASTKAALDARGIALTLEQINAVGEELSKVRIAALARGRVVRRAFGYFTDESTCGGTHDDPDFTPTLDNMNAGVRGRLAPDGLALFDSQLTFLRDGVLGGKVPTVTRIYDGATRLLERITLGGPFRISGPESFGPEPAAGATTLGLFLERTGGTPVRIGMFSKWTETEIFGSWPAAISGTGDVELRVVTLYPNNTDPSEFVYTPSLPIVP